MLRVPLRRLAATALALCCIATAFRALAGPDSTATDTVKASAATAPPTGGDSTATDSAHAKPAAPPEHVGDPALGKKIFSVKCVACHKADGSGGIKVTGNPTPDFRDPKHWADGKHDDAYLRDCITNGKPKSGMPTWSKQGVKPRDIDNLIAYIHTFLKKK